MPLDVYQAWTWWIEKNHRLSGMRGLQLLTAQRIAQSASDLKRQYSAYDVAPQLDPDYWKKEYDRLKKLPPAQLDRPRAEQEAYIARRGG